MKQCPFCNGDPKRDKELRDGYQTMQDDPDAYAFFVRCVSCGAQGGWAKTEGNADRLWDMRHRDA